MEQQKPQDQNPPGNGQDPQPEQRPKWGGSGGSVSGPARAFEPEKTLGQGLREHYFGYRPRA